MSFHCVVGEIVTACLAVLWLTVAALTVDAARLWGSVGAECARQLRSWLSHGAVAVTRQAGFAKIPRATVSCADGLGDRDLTPQCKKCLGSISDKRRELCRRGAGDDGNAQR
jgi:hypothetical protein